MECANKKMTSKVCHYMYVNKVSHAQANDNYSTLFALYFSGACSAQHRVVLDNLLIFGGLYLQKFEETELN